jgi:hypothetical protein
MKFIFLFLITISLNVQAEWIFMGSTDNATSYVDTESYKRTGSTVRFWQLDNFLIPQSINGSSKFYLSSKAKKEMNCNTEESLLLAIIDYSENDGKGKVVNSFQFDDKQFRHIVPESIGHTIFKFVCNKK